MDFAIVGLGNPGPQYELSPHNMGFMAVDRLAARNGIRMVRPECRALVGVGRIAGSEVLLAKPQTYMNLSGTSVRPLLEKWGLDPSRLIVVYDDLDLPWGSIRIRAKGSAGGHHGMESVIQMAGTSEFVRVRLGVHPGFEIRDDVEYLLAPLRSGLRKELDPLLDRAAEAVESIIAEGVEMSMTKYNRRAGGVNEGT
jgi:PTH1 family peptidyl-tRNA hydrolase